MGHPLRDRDPSIYRLITIRTVRGEMWLMPDGRNTRLIGGILARYQEILGIEIYAYAILTNHIHLLIRAPRGNADEFAENVNREISRRINWRYRREGSLWGRRYSEQEVLKEDDLVEALLYVATNCTRHGLLRDASQWRGLNSFKHLLSENDRKFSFTLHSKVSEGGVPLQTTHRLRLSVLPQFAELSKGRRRKKIASLLQGRLAELWERRRGKAFLGQLRVDDQVPGDIPMRMNRTPRPSCYTKCVKSLKEYLEVRKLLRERYSEASTQYRLGDISTSFPKFTFKPPLHRVPRLAPFVLCGPGTQKITT